MELRTKSWIWKLTWPFAHANYTNLFGTCYYPKGRPPYESIIEHEKVHTRQAKYVGGWFKYYLLYLFCFPFLYNPWRKKWEIEAYVYGSGYTEDQARARLRTAMYGWIL